MRLLRASVLRFIAMFGRRRADDDLSQELTDHLQAHIDDNVRAGMALEQAQRMARLKLGGMAQTQEAYRHVRSFAWLDDAREDLRYAWRTHRRAPGFAATAVTVIALGIGAATASFTILDYTLLRPLPFPEPDRLVHIYQSDLARGVPR